MRICMKHLFQRCHWTPFDTSLVLNPKMAVVRNSCNRMVSMMSETKHIGPGSECPPLKPGTLRLYSMKFCPYAERTRLVLAAKDVPHEVVNVNLKQKPDWFLAKYETAKVPALELDDKLVPESLVTCDLLEELHPEPALYPADPWQKARDRYFIELFNGCIIVLHRMYRYAGDVEKTKELGESFDSKIQPFELELMRRGTPFFHGGRPGLLDLMIWPWMERLASFARLNADGDAVLPLTVTGRLEEWTARMREHPDVKKCVITTEKHVRFLISNKTDFPDYDMEGV